MNIKLENKQKNTVDIMIESVDNNVEVENCIEWLESNDIYFEFEEYYDKKYIVTKFKKVKNKDAFYFVLMFS